MAAIQTETQKSAGGVVFRLLEHRTEVALISVGNPARWQLPKGIIDKDESSEKAAIREVREEAGVISEPVRPIETIEYWYVSSRNGERVRYHKFVDFYLLRYVSGDTEDHDHEVNEARWYEIKEAVEKLAFDGERRVLGKAAEMIRAISRK